jgi:hypothetical protein
VAELKKTEQRDEWVAKEPMELPVSGNEISTPGLRHSAGWGMTQSAR